MTRPRILLLVSALLLGAAAVASWRAVAPTPCEDPAAVEVAADFSRDLLTYDATRVEEQVSRVLEYGDERFVEEYAAAAGPDFVQQVRDNSTRAEARLLDGPALDACEDGKPSFGVLVSQVVQRDGDERPRTLRTPLRVTLVRVDATWRVHEVEIL